MLALDAASETEKASMVSAAVRKLCAEQREIAQNSFGRKRSTVSVDDLPYRYASGLESNLMLCRLSFHRQV